MSNPIDPFDEISGEEIFAELRAFAATPVPEDENVLATLVHEFSAASAAKPHRWIKRLVIPTITIVIAVPSLAYAGLLPEGVSTNIKEIVHTVSTVVSKPIVAISNSITGKTNEPQLNSSPTGNPSPDAPAVPSGTNSDESNSAELTGDEGNALSNEGDPEQVITVVSTPTSSPTPSRNVSQVHSLSPSPSTSRSHSEEGHKGTEAPKAPIAMPSPKSESQEVEHENEIENESHTTSSQINTPPSPQGPNESSRPTGTSTSSSRERESDRTRVRNSSSPSPISSPGATHETDD